jgi:hypothetical protein
MGKKKTAKSKRGIKDLKAKNAKSVKGGRIVNIRANASGISSGPSGTPGVVQASIQG